MKALSLATNPPREELNVRFKKLYQGLAKLGVEVHHYGVRPLHAKGLKISSKVYLDNGVWWHEYYSPRILRKLAIAKGMLEFYGEGCDVVITKDPLCSLVALPKRFQSRLIFDYEDVISLELALQGDVERACVYRRLERLAGLSSSLTITENDYLRNYLVEVVGLPPGKVKVVPNGVDISRFNPDLYDPDEVKEELGITGPVVGFVGKTIHPFYLDLLFEALPLIIKRHPNATFLVIGKSSPWMSKYSKALEHTVFTGRVAHDHVPRLLSAVDVAVNPVSRLTVGSIKIIEYLAMGKPVVVTTRLVNDHVKKSQACLIVRPKPREVAMAIDRLLSDPELREKLGERGRRYAEGFSWEGVASRFLKALQGLEDHW